MRSALVLLPVALATLASVARADDGADVWAHHCKMCHGADGAGDTPAGKKMEVLSLKVPKWASADALEKIETAVRDGAGKMPAMASKLSAEEIAAVAQYTQHLAGAK